jgi:hypothetical protein
MKSAAQRQRGKAAAPILDQPSPAGSPHARAAASRHPHEPGPPDPTPRRIFRRLGPGLVTGAADDDPSGNATYSQVGALAGFALGWTMVLSFPLMIAVQEACARIGFATGRGIARNLRRTTSSPALYGAGLPSTPP